MEEIKYFLRDSAMASGTEREEYFRDFIASFLRESLPDQYHTPVAGPAANGATRGHAVLDNNDIEEISRRAAEAILASNPAGIEKLDAWIDTNWPAFMTSADNEARDWARTASSEAVQAVTTAATATNLVAAPTYEQVDAARSDVQKAIQAVEINGEIVFSSLSLGGAAIDGRVEAAVTGAEVAATGVSPDGFEVADPAAFRQQLVSFFTQQLDGNGQNDRASLEAMREALGIEGDITVIGSDTAGIGQPDFLNYDAYEQIAGFVNEKLADGLSASELQEIRTAFEGVQLTRDTAARDAKYGELDRDELGTLQTELLEGLAEVSIEGAAAGTEDAAREGDEKAVVSPPHTPHCPDDGSRECRIA